MNNTFFKRIGAYLLDIFLVAVVVYLLSMIPILNPNQSSYTEKYNELLNLADQYSNEEISYEEYEQAYYPISYELYKLNTYYVIIDIICVLLYFGVFQYFYNGQTIGKKLFNLRVVSKDEKPLTIVNYLVRTVVLENVLISIILLLIVHFMNADNYYNVYENVNLVGSIIRYIILFMAIVRLDGRGLHDYVANTKVVLDGYNEEKIKEEQKVIELEAKEVSKKKKKK